MTLFHGMHMQASSSYINISALMIIYKSDSNNNCNGNNTIAGVLISYQFLKLNYLIHITCYIPFQMSDELLNKQLQHIIAKNLLLILQR